MESIGSSQMPGSDPAAMAADCERYWREAGVPGRTASEMRLELQAHLEAAIADGRSVADVVGSDLGTFAEAWAAEQRVGTGRLPSWNEVIERDRRRPGRRDALALGAVIAAVTVAAVIAFGTESEGTMDEEMWRWIWVGAAVFLAFAEIVTAGFFMLPFAGGAAVAAILAWLGVNPAVQLVVFIAVSLVVLVGLQRFVRRSDEAQPQVGATRFVGQRAVVLERIDRNSTGRVRMDTELWRASTEGGPLEEGTEVVVVDVRGARLIVEAVE
jgi:membrane protein implicated in regulation of membrane protease activity